MGRLRICQGAALLYQPGHSRADGDRVFQWAPHYPGRRHLPFFAPVLELARAMSEGGTPGGPAVTRFRDMTIPRNGGPFCPGTLTAVSYTHLRAHETDSYLVCRLLLEKKKK